jgi:hypothetical protein
MPCISTAMSQESQEYITVHNKTPFLLTVIPRKSGLNATGQFYLIPQHNHQISIAPDSLHTVIAFPLGTKKMAFFFLNIGTKKMPVFTSKDHNTITIGVLEKSFFCNKTKSRHNPTPQITFTRDIIDK